MNRFKHLIGLALLLLLAPIAAGCKPRGDAPGPNAGPSPIGPSGASGPFFSLDPKIGFVLHGLNDFTAVIEQGAKDAGRDERIDEPEVVGPASWKTSDAIAMFEGMIQKKKDGLVVIPFPGEMWVTPIKEATDAGIPVLTTNVSSADSTASAWFGIDEYAGGEMLGREVRRQLEKSGKREGQIIVGMCKPGLNVLMDRYNGFKKAMEGTRYKISSPMDVKMNTDENYTAWESLSTANADVVAYIGLCAMDLPNMAKLKKRKLISCLLAGYDLGEQTTEFIKAGVIQAAIGQHPYLQGYLPVRAMAQHLRGKKPLPKGWIPIEPELVTSENIHDALVNRETDAAAQTKWYADYIQRKFADLSKLAKPMPQKHD